MPVVRHVEVKVPIVVVVEESPAAGPIGPVDSCVLVMSLKVPLPLLRKSTFGP